MLVIFYTQVLLCLCTHSIRDNNTEYRTWDVGSKRKLNGNEDGKLLFL